MHGFSGAKGGSGGSSSFKQRPDTLRSTDTFEGLLGLCAGPIKGLTRGLKSLKIDGTPLEDESGKLNFENFLAILADGDPTSFPQEVNLRLGAGGSPVAVNLALSNTNSSGPGPWVTKTIANQGADFLDFRFLVNQLYRQDKSGIFEHTANIEIQLKPTGTTNWISPMLGTPSQSYNQSGVPSALPGQKLYVPRTNYDSSGNYKPETNLGYFQISGKTTSVAVHELRITVPNTDAYENVGWDVRARLIEKESVDADPNFEKRTITWESVSAGYNTKLGVTEPWRGLAWLQLYGKASDQLTGVPTVEGEYDTLIVPVPPSSVFDPETRAYTTAIWDGSWARSFTTDPAWNINGLLTDALHGMASVSPGAHLNKWDALEASKWFSELVPDGNGGTEPRYSLNVAINEPQKAAEFVPYLAGAVGALAWEENAGEWRIKVDKPENPSDLFTLEAIEGEFRYSHTNVDTRFNDITVVFLNKEFGYREDRVRVVDSAHIARFGRKPTTFVAIGCTGRQEALRRAIMRLRVSTRETRMVNFTTNRRGRLVRPLSTILIADGDLGTLIDSDENTRSTGRIVAIASDRMSLSVRDPLRLELGIDYDVTFTLPNPDYAPDADVDPQGEDVTLPTITQTVALTNTAGQRGNVTTLYLAAALPANVAPNANLALSATNLPALPKQYRVTHVEPDGERVAISAIEIDTGKWDASDSGVAEEGYVPPSDVVVPTVLNAVISTGSFESEYGTNLTLNVNWDRPAGAALAGYRTEYRVNGADWVRINSRTSLTSIEIVNPQFGKWDFRITTLDRAGRTSEPVIVSIVVDENLKPGYYADGTPIDDLKPAEPGATEGGTIGDNIKDGAGNVVPPEDLYTSLGISLDTFKVNGVASEDVLNAIATAQAEVDDLIETYGETASAAASADAAEAYKNLADAAAIAAADSATSSAGSASASAGSATVATAKADEADASATAAEANMLQAQYSAAITFPSDFSQDSKFWTRTVSQPPTTAPDLEATYYTFESASGAGRVCRIDPPSTVGFYLDVTSKEVLKLVAGRRYRATVRARLVRANTAGGGDRFQVSLTGANSSYGWSGWTASTVDDVTTGDGWVDLIVEADADTALLGGADTVYIRPFFRYSTTSGSPAYATNGAAQIQYIKFEDITESTLASSSASAASASASSASADAAAASSQASLASGYKDTAQSAATAASGSATTASSQASAAATSASLSATYRDQSAANAATRGLTPNGDFSQGNTGWDNGAGEADGAGPAASFTPTASWNGAADVLVNSANVRKNLRERARQVIAGRKYRVHWRYRVTATCANVVYIRGFDASGAYIGVSATIPHSSSSPALNTWIEGSSDFDASALAGYAKFCVSFNSNVGTDPATIGVDYFYVEDITDSAASEASATISAAQAVVATSQAAAATSSATLAANLSSQGFLDNSAFASWASTYPDGYVNWQGIGTISMMSKYPPGRYGSPQALRLNGGTPSSGDTGAGIMATKAIPQTYLQPFSSNQWVVIEVDARVTGDCRGAGVLFRVGDTSTQSATLDLYTDPDTAGVTGNGSSSTIRQWRKLVQMSGPTSTSNNILRQYIMNIWTGFPSYTSAAGARDIFWYYVNVRPASDAEIKTQQIDGLSAEVTTASSVLATHDTQLANLETSVSTQGATISTQQTSLNGLQLRYSVTLNSNGHISGFQQNNNGTTSDFIVQADKFMVAMPGYTPKVIFGVNAAGVLVNGDLLINNGKIITDTGTFMEVAGKGFGTSNQFLRWYGPKMALNLCSESNGVFWIKTNGDAYFGGSLSTGVLKNSIQTSDLATNASVICGPFGANGGPIVCAVSWTYTETVSATYSGDAAGIAAWNTDVGNFSNGSNTAPTLETTRTVTRANSTLTLARKIGAGSFGNVQSAGVTAQTQSFQGTRPQLAGGQGNATITLSTVLSFTYTDNSGSTSDREFRATIARGSIGYGSSPATGWSGSVNASQRISIVTTEE